MMTNKFGVTLFMLIAGIYYSMARDVHKVSCSEDAMKIEIVTPPSIDSLIYLEKMKSFPNPKCHPTITDHRAEFQLSLKKFDECGMTKVVNKLTGKKIFYHKIIIEHDKMKEYINVKCILMPATIYTSRHDHKLQKRDNLPLGFEEPIDLDITSLERRAPEPILHVGVRQGKEIITDELNVSPGTPLSMEIYLDKNSSSVYGIGVTYMQVTDTKAQEETIIFNGCSIDPYLFDNFNAVDGSSLVAKFRAFKFPDSTYVQFRGTVNVCLNKCEGVQCSNGQIGNGRKKRQSTPIKGNNIYEISMTTFVNVVDNNSIDPNIRNDLEDHLNQLHISNQKLDRNNRRSIFEDFENQRHAIVEETTIFDVQKNKSNRIILNIKNIGLIWIILSATLLKCCS